MQRPARGIHQQTPVGYQPDEDLAELAVGFDRRSDPPHPAVDPVRADLDLGGLVDLQLRNVLGRNQADQVEFASGDNAEQRLALARCGGADHRRGRGDQACDRGLHQRGAAFGKGEPGQRLTGGHGIAGIGQDFRDLEALPLRADHGFIARNDRARDLDNGGEAGLCRVDHGDGRPLGRVVVGAKAWLRRKTEQRGGKRGELARSGGEVGHRHCIPFFRDQGYQKAGGGAKGGAKRE